MLDFQDRIYSIEVKANRSPLEEEILRIYDASLNDGLDDEEFLQILGKLNELDIQFVASGTSTQSSVLQLSLETSLRPNAREVNIESQEDAIGLEYMALEGIDGFQEYKNDGMTLNDALDTFGFSEYTMSCLPYIFGRALDEGEIEQLILMIKYTNSIESQYGYNLTRHDIPELPSGYAQYQIYDGIASKEIYDYGTRSFSDAGEWGPNDIEVVDHKGDDRAWIRRVWKNSSYDTALVALPAIIRLQNPKFAQDYKNIGDPNSQKFPLLNSQEQLVLFLADSMRKTGGEDYFNRILSGDKTAIVDMYISNHNTNPEDDTERSKNIYSVIRGRAEEILGITYP